TVRPATNCGCLRQPRAHLPGADVKPSGTFQCRQVGADFTSQRKFLAREWSQSDSLNQPFLFFPENTEKIYHLAVEIIECFHRRRIAIEQHRAGTGKRLAVMMTMGQQRQQPVEMRKFSAIPAEGDEFLFFLQTSDWRWSDPPTPGNIAVLQGFCDFFGYLNMC